MVVGAGNKGRKLMKSKKQRLLDELHALREENKRLVDIILAQAGEQNGRLLLGYDYLGEEEVEDVI